MSLIEIIAGVEAREATLTVFDTDPAVAETLTDHFADRNLAVEERLTDGTRTTASTSYFRRRAVRRSEFLTKQTDGFRRPDVW